MEPKYKINQVTINHPQNKVLVTLVNKTGVFITVTLPLAELTSPDQPDVTLVPNPEFLEWLETFEEALLQEVLTKL